MPNLKPCPFCGASGEDLGNQDETLVVWCRQCGAEGPTQWGGHRTLDRRATWNRRAGEDR